MHRPALATRFLRDVDKKQRWRERKDVERAQRDNGLTYRPVIAMALLYPDQSRPPAATSCTYLRATTLDLSRFFFFHPGNYREPRDSMKRTPGLSWSIEKYERFHETQDLLRRLPLERYLTNWQLSISRAILEKASGVLFLFLLLCPYFLYLSSSFSSSLSSSSLLFVVLLCSSFSLLSLSLLSPTPYRFPSCRYSSCMKLFMLSFSFLLLFLVLFFHPILFIETTRALERFMPNYRNSIVRVFSKFILYNGVARLTTILVTSSFSSSLLSSLRPLFRSWPCFRFLVCQWTHPVDARS